MNVLPLLALATGLNLAAPPAQAAHTRAAEARLDTLVSTAEPTLAARGIDAALATGLHRYTQSSAGQIAASRLTSAPVAVQPAADAGSQDFAPLAQRRLNSLVNVAAPRIHRQAVDAALVDGTRKLGQCVDTQIASLRSNAPAADEVAALRSPGPGATVIHSNAP